MATSRLTTALNEGDLVLPEGRVAVMRPPAGYDLGALPREAVTVVHSFRPDYDYWADMGYDVAQTLSDVAAIVVVVPRSKVLARAMIAAAVRTAPLVIIDGQRTDGIDSLFKDLRKRFGAAPSVTKAHGRLFWLQDAGPMAEWDAKPAEQADDGYWRQAGVFSENGIDRGSAQLIKALPAKLPPKLADLGAGWGYLSAEILRSRPAVTHIDLIEAEHLALDCARLNVTDARASHHWADAIRFQPEGKHDGIVSNPPFHTSRAADASIGRSFIAAAAKMLASNGHFWMVANRHLPYEATLSDHFLRVEEIGGDGAFKVIHAHRPKK